MMDEINKEEVPQTYGTGEREEYPRGEAPEKVATPDGRVHDLRDDSLTVSSPELIDICGQKIDASEFGEDGLEFISLLYEQWLFSVNRDNESTFSSDDEGGVDSSRILIEAKTHYPRLMSMVRQRTVTVGNKPTTQMYVPWDRNTTLEQWIGWTAATLRWRINYEIERRRFLQGLRDIDIKQAKEVCEQALIFCEKWLALGEKKRLTSI